MVDSTSRGHGGEDGWVLDPMDCGAVGNGTTEYNEVSWINERWLQLLPSLKDASDFKATNVPDNLYLIVQNHNKISSSKELVYSQHMNAFNRIARGVEVWYYLGDPLGKKTAEKASAAIAEALGIPNRGAKATTNLYVVSNTNATCLLIEWIFIDNKDDYNAWVKNKEKAVVAALKAIGYPNIKNDNGGNTVTKPVQPPKQKIKEGFWDTAGKIEILQDVDTWNKDFTKKNPNWKFKKGTIIDTSSIVITSSGSTHARVGENPNLFITLNKNYVKRVSK